MQIGYKIYSYRDIDEGQNAEPSVCHHAWPCDQTSYIRLQSAVAVFTLPRDAVYVLAQVVRDQCAGFLDLPVALITPQGTADAGVTPRFCGRLNYCPFGEEPQFT